MLAIAPSCYSCVDATTCSATLRTNLPLFACLIAIPIAPAIAYVITGSFTLVWAALPLLFVILLEGLWRWINYVIFHHDHVDVSRNHWGSVGEGSDRIKVSIPYGGIKSASITNDGELEIFVSRVTRWYEVTGDNASIAFRPEDIQGILGEISSRAGIVSDSPPRISTDVP